MIDKDYVILNETKHNNPNPLKNGPFSMLIVGSPKSGKSTFLFNVMNNLDNHFNKCVLYIPVARLDKTLGDHISKDCELIEDGKEFIIRLKQLMDDARKRNDEDKKPTTVLFIMDDSTADKSLFPNSFRGDIIQIYTRYRHYNFSLIQAVHSIFHCPPTARKNIQFYILFPVSEKELDEMKKSSKIPFKAIKQAYDENIRTLHDFIIIDNFERKIFNKEMVEIYSQF